MSLRSNPRHAQAAARRLTEEIADQIERLRQLEAAVHADEQADEQAALWGERPAWFTWLHGAPQTRAQHALAYRTRRYIEQAITQSERSR